MDKFITTDLGGIPRTLDDLRWFLGQSSNQGIYQALNNLLGSFGTNFIVQGCEVTGTAPAQSLSEGWIVLNGELLKVDAISGTLDTGVNSTFTKDATDFDASGLKDLQSGGTANTYNKVRGVLSGTGGSLNVLTGDRYKDQFDEWKTFDITGTNTNFVSNSAATGLVANDVALDTANSGSSHFRYKIVGKTVYWSLNADFTIQSNAAGSIGSIVIRNLPFTAKTNQQQAIKMDSVFWNANPTLGVSNTTMLTQNATEDRMIITMSVFNGAALSLNRYYQWQTAPSMEVIAVGSTSVTFQYTINGNGVFEIE